MSLQYERLVAKSSPALHAALQERFDAGDIGSVDVLEFEYAHAPASPPSYAS
jgi:hypothetical protein